LIVVIVEAIEDMRPCNLWPQSWMMFKRWDWLVVIGHLLSFCTRIQLRGAPHMTLVL
jgi:hypothetical protein